MWTQNPILTSTDLLNGLKRWVNPGALWKDVEEPDTHPCTLCSRITPRWREVRETLIVSRAINFHVRKNTDSTNENNISTNLMRCNCYRWINKYIYYRCSLCSQGRGFLFDDVVSNWYNYPSQKTTRVLPWLSLNRYKGFFVQYFKLCPCRCWRIYVHI